jgi:hypothetical protein
MMRDLDSEGRRWLAGAGAGADVSTVVIRDFYQIHPLVVRPLTEVSQPIDAAEGDSKGQLGRARRAAHRALLLLPEIGDSFVPLILWTKEGWTAEFARFARRPGGFPLDLGSGRAPA